MRRFLLSCLCIAVFARPVESQRRAAANVAPVVTPPASIDAFVQTVRDMAAWAIVTPSAHIPVGGIQDSVGNIESVVTAQNGPPITPDSSLAAFRETLGTAARRRKVTAVGLAYLARRTPPGASALVDAVIVEVEHGGGYRADLLFPYTRNDFGEPVFGAAFTAPGTLHALDTRRKRGVR